MKPWGYHAHFDAGRVVKWGSTIIIYDINALSKKIQQIVLTTRKEESLSKYKVSNIYLYKIKSISLREKRCARKCGWRRAGSMPAPAKSISSSIMWRRGLSQRRDRRGEEIKPWAFNCVLTCGVFGWPKFHSTVALTGQREEANHWNEQPMPYIKSLPNCCDRMSAQANGRLTHKE